MTTNSREYQRLYMRKYRLTEQGRTTDQRYNRSEKGRERNNKYCMTTRHVRRLALQRKIAESRLSQVREEIGWLTR